MAKLTFASSAAYPLTGPVEVDLCELERARPGSPTYTFDTLQELRRKIPQLAFVIGTDQLLKFHTWHRFPDVLGLSHWIILERKNRGTADPETIRQVLGQWEGSGLVRSEGSSWRVRDGGTILLPIPTPAPALSSTEIRESLARSGNPPEGSILPEVHNYLMSRRLYGTGRA